MKPKVLVATLALLAMSSFVNAQDCRNGQCRIGYTEELIPFTLNELLDAEQIELTADENEVAAPSVDRFQRVVEATCRVTVSGVCGSGTVVGRDSAGNALVLTNAHVAGTQRGRVVQLQRWNTDGTSERGQGAIIASGYGRGLSVDFALLKCNSQFAENVQPIPLADRYPDVKAGLSTYGCPRCEWPSMQVLSMTRAEGQVLKWKPEAIGGRSGSSVIDYTDAGPRVVGLLTWGGGGEGLGQSTPFLLEAMRGRLPKAFETLPPGVREVGAADLDVSTCSPVRRVPCRCDGTMLAFAQVDPNASAEIMRVATEDESSGATESEIINQIVENGPDASPDDDCGLLNRDKDKDKDKDKPSRPIRDWIGWLRDTAKLLTFVLAAAVVGWLVGRFLPL